eukprot:767895-Hanusia_phi.AAC.11
MQTGDIARDLWNRVSQMMPREQTAGKLVEVGQARRPPPGYDEVSAIDRSGTTRSRKPHNARASPASIRQRQSTLSSTTFPVS